MSENFTWYGSNITNVWQEIFMPMTLAFSCEVMHVKKVKIRQYLQKLQQKNQWHLFSGHDVYAHITINATIPIYLGQSVVP